MVRQRNRKTNRGKKNDQVQEAAFDALRDGTPVRQVARNYDVCHVSVGRYMKKLKKAQDEGKPAPEMGYKSHHRIFTEAQESELVKYILRAADLYYGLTPMEVRRFAFLLTQTYNITVPAVWGVNQMAGPDWFTNFRKRHHELSTRKPQATSLARATAFNKTMVNEFFDNLTTAMSRTTSSPKTSIM